MCWLSHSDSNCHSAVRSEHMCEHSCIYRTLEKSNKTCWCNLHSKDCYIRLIPSVTQQYSLVYKTINSKTFQAEVIFHIRTGVHWVNLHGDTGSAMGTRTRGTGHRQCHGDQAKGDTTRTSKYQLGLDLMTIRTFTVHSCIDSTNAPRFICNELHVYYNANAIWTIQKWNSG